MGLLSQKKKIKINKETDIIVYFSQITIIIQKMNDIHTIIHILSTNHLIHLIF